MILFGIYCLMLLLTPFWDYQGLPQIGQSWTVIKLVGVVVLVGAVLKTVFGERTIHFFRWTEIRLFLIFYGMAGISFLAVSEGSWGTGPIQIYTSSAVSLLAGLVFLDSESRLEKASYVVLFSMILASYSVFSQYFRYGNRRPGGIIGDANYFALIAVMLLPLAAFLFSTATGYRKLLLLVAGIAMTGATLLSGSRGGLLSLGVGVAYALLQTRRKALFLTTTALILIGFVLALPETGLNRFTKSDYGADASTRAHTELLKAGWAMIKARPLLGIGLGMYKPLSPRYNPAMEGDVGFTAMGHNTYVEIAAELGVPACMVFLLLLFSSWRQARRASDFFARQGRRVSSGIAKAVETGIVAYSVGALFLSAEYTKQLWLIISFGLALALLRAEQEETEDAVSSADWADVEPVENGVVPVHD